MTVDRQKSDWARRLGFRWLSTRYQECIAWFLAITSVIATISTLVPWQGKPFPQWPLGITINALIAVYAVIFEAAISFLVANGLSQAQWLWFETARPLRDLPTYDGATRGPLGAGSLIWKMRFRNLWSSFGASLVLIAFFIDPFIQQVIQKQDCLISTDSNTASIPRTSFFLNAMDTIGRDDQNAPPALQNSISAGIVAPGQTVQPKCPSGNCTFPEYSTIGYCSRCVDISNNLKSNSSVEYIRNGWNMSVVQNNHDFFTGQSANLALMAPMENATFQIILGNTGLGHFNPFTGKTRTDCGANDPSWKCQGYGAANCDLFPCIRSYKASVVNGTLNERLVSQSSNFGFPQQNGYSYLATIQNSCLRDAERDTLHRMGYEFAPNDGWIPYNLSFEAVVDPPREQGYGKHIQTPPAFLEPLLKRGCIYLMDESFQRTMMLIYFGLDDLFSGILTGVWSSYDNGVQTMDQLMGPQVLQRIYNWGDFDFERVDSTFQNISNAMTTYMRLNPLPPGITNLYNMTVPAYGTVLDNQTCLRARWVWLILPGALLILTSVFSVGVLNQSKFGLQEVKEWRSSPLPLLFHGLHYDNDDMEGLPWHSNLNRMKDMELVADKLQLSTAIHPSGWVYLRPQKDILLK